MQDINDSNVDIFLTGLTAKSMKSLWGLLILSTALSFLRFSFYWQRTSVYYDKKGSPSPFGKMNITPIHDKLIYTSVSRLRKLIEPKCDEGKESKRKYILRGKDGYTFNPLAKIRFYMEQKTSSYKSIGNVDLSSPI